MPCVICALHLLCFKLISYILLRFVRNMTITFMKHKAFLIMFGNPFMSQVFISLVLLLCTLVLSP